MKKFLFIRIPLYLLTLLFSVSVLSQSIPDPGRDPLHPVDSIAQKTTLKSGVANRKETTDVHASKATSQGFGNSADYASGYKHEEKLEQPLK